MRTLRLFLILGLLPIYATAQIERHKLLNEKYENNTYVYINNDSTLSKVEKFKNAKIWVAKTFTDYKEAVQLEDEDAGSIIIKGCNPMDEMIDIGIKNAYVKYDVDLLYTLSIDLRDNKFRLKFEDLAISGKKITQIGLMNKENDVDMPIIEFINKGEHFKMDIATSFSSFLNSAINMILIKDDF